MDERQQPTWASEGLAGSAEVSERIRAILAEAEAAANAVRHQAEQDAQSRRRAAETESLEITERARREAEQFLSERIKAVSDLSDEILRRGQSVVERLDEADRVRADLASLVTALGETSSRLALELRAGPQGPRAPEATVEVPAPDRPTVRPSDPLPAPEPVAAEPEPAPEPDPEPPPILDEDPPLRAPTPIRAESLYGEEVSSADFGEPADVDAAEAALLEQVRQAEQERAEDDSGPGFEGEAARAANAGTPVEAVEEAETATTGEAETTEAESEPEESEESEGRETAAPQSVVELVAAAVDEKRDPGAGPDQALGARLVALQMAVAGGNRGEVESHLKRAFDLSDPAAILDDIFGSGTTPDKRVVWPAEAG